MRYKHILWLCAVWCVVGLLCDRFVSEIKEHYSQPDTYNKKECNLVNNMYYGILLIT
jgi:hypothetical protein